MRWHEVLRGCDDCSALYDAGIARRGSEVWIRLNGITTAAVYGSDVEAIDAYIADEPTVSAALANGSGV